MLFTLNSALIEIEFIGADFTTLSISPLEELVVFNADTISNNCTNCTPGCTYNAACNFNPLADNDDGSCAFPELGYDCNGNCTFDIDQDGICDFEETYGCSYPSASNFNPLATEDNGICFFELESACPTDVDDDGRHRCLRHFKRLIQLWLHLSITPLSSELDNYGPKTDGEVG